MEQLHIVIGAGALARAVATHLVGQGARVRVVSRTGEARVAGAESARADASQADELRIALAGATVVYQCARPRYSRWVEEFPRLHDTVVGETARVGASLVLADNLYAYGDPGSAVISETTPENPRTRKGAVRKSLADSALAAHRAGTLRVAIVRAADFFGPGHDQSSAAIFRAAARGRTMTVIGSLDKPRSTSYLPDVAAAMATIGLGDRGWGRGWIAPVQPAITQSEFAAAVWEAAGQSGAPRVRAVGPRKLAAAGLVNADARELREMTYLHEAPFVVDSSAFEAEFGVRPTPLPEAVAATVDHYRAEATSSSRALSARPSRPRRAWRGLVNAAAALGVAIVLALGVGAGIDISNFDRTTGGYESPYEGWTGTPTDWSAGAVTSDGFRNPGFVLDTLFDCTTGMISVEAFGWVIDFRVVSERGVAVHRPIESCIDAGFEPDFVPTPGV